MGIKSLIAGMNEQTTLEGISPTGAQSAAITYGSQFTTTTLGRRLRNCEDVVGIIAKNETKHVVSCGDWSMEHLVAHLADQIGPVDLMFATWSVNDAALARLVTAIEQGAIRSCRAIFDWRVKVRKPNAHTMISAAMPKADIRLTSSHAKVYIMRNGDRAISVVSSANLTTNPRIEATVITDSIDVYEFHKTWMDAELAHAKPFEDDTK